MNRQKKNLQIFVFESFPFALGSICIFFRESIVSTTFHRSYAVNLNKSFLSFYWKFNTIGRYFKRNQFLNDLDLKREQKISDKYQQSFEKYKLNKELHFKSPDKNLNKNWFYVKNNKTKLISTKVSEASRVLILEEL